MSAPAWFDKDVYLANKLAQLKADEPNNGWTEMKMLEAFNNAGFNPFTDDGVYAHFVAFGNAEDVSPNQYFDVEYYFQQKLEQLKTTEPDAGWKNVDQVKQAFADAGLSAWDHYTLYGISEGINPSIFFNTEDYMKAKLDQMQADDPTYTKDDLLKAFKDADLNPIEHYVLFGQNEKLSYSPYAVDGGYAPLPEKGISVTEAQKLTEPGYILEDSVSNLAGADYTAINNAKSVTVADAVSGFTTDAAATAKVLAFADNVVVKDVLATIAQNVLNGTLPDFGNTSTSLLVTGTSATATTVDLGTVSVAVAAEGQTLLDVFLARTDVSYQDGKPTALTLGTYGIEDTAANVVAADADLLSGATSVTVDDTVANVSANLTAIDSYTINVTDTLANIFGMSNGTATSLTGASASFVATDEGDATVSYAAIMGTLGDGSHKINIDAADSVTLDASAQAGALDVNLDNLFTSTDGTTVSYLGSAGADTVTANANGGTIDGGLGADDITLGAGVDTVVLGSGISSAADLVSNNVDTISSFTAGDGTNADKLDFAGLLDGFGSDDFVTMNTGAGDVSANIVSDGQVVVYASGAAGTADVAGLFESVSASAGIADMFLDTDDAIILITKDGTGANVWYVENTNGQAGVQGDEVHLVATLDTVDPSTLTANNIA